jgi:hypothetical protein
MRIAPPVQRAVATFLFVLYTACTVLGGGLVRCREADGSVSLEWRGSECCMPLPETGGPSAPVVDADGDDPQPDCAGCEDELFTRSLASFAARKAPAGEAEAAKAAVAVAAIASPPRFAFTPAGDDRPRRVRAPIPPPPLLGLRSVVLRC